MKKYKYLKCFLLFLGKGRSGSSLCGGLISCHPNAVVAHQTEFKNFKFQKEIELYEYLINSQNEIKHIWKPLRTLDFIWIRNYQNLKVIGTKKQGTFIQSSSDFYRLKQLKQKLSIPIRFINIYRNPFDNITTMFNTSQRKRNIERGTNMKNLNRAITYYFQGIKVTQEVINREVVLNVKHEDLVNNTRRTMIDICYFLELPVMNQHLDFCDELVWPEARQTRQTVEWSKKDKDRVMKAIRKYDFLKDYRWE